MLLQLMNDLYKLSDTKKKGFVYTIILLRDSIKNSLFLKYKTNSLFI